MVEPLSKWAKLSCFAESHTSAIGSGVRRRE